LFLNVQKSDGCRDFRRICRKVGMVLFFKLCRFGFGRNLNLPNIEQTQVYYNWQIIAEDPDDNKFVDAAISSGADYIITHDKHFKILDLIDFPVVKYVSLEAFEEILK
jgi:hypothetical protein